MHNNVINGTNLALESVGLPRHLMIIQFNPMPIVRCLSGKHLTGEIKSLIR